MAKAISVEGFTALENALENLAQQVVYILFSGSADANGTSWCPDCIVADPVINESMKYFPAGATFIHCGVGDRISWKDMTNPFRTKMGISCVPTLLKWGTMNKLEEQQCAKIDLIQMLYEEAD